MGQQAMVGLVRMGGGDTSALDARLKGGGAAPAAPMTAPTPTASGPEGKEMGEEARAASARKRGRSGLRIDPTGVSGLGGGVGVNTPQG